MYNTPVLCLSHALARYLRSQGFRVRYAETAVPESPPATSCAKLEKALSAAAAGELILSAGPVQVQHHEAVSFFVGEDFEAWLRRTQLLRN